jgi:hypothetical protein
MFGLRVWWYDHKEYLPRFHEASEFLLPQAFQIISGEIRTLDVLIS